MNIMELTLEQFLDEAASATPTPGGGSVASYSGALAAAMLCMAARLTIGKKGYETVEEQVAGVEREAADCLQRLKKGVPQDIAVFDTFMDTLQLPKNTEEEKRERTEKLRLAYYDATESPLSIAENALRLIELACFLAPISNKNVVSDVGVAVSLALGAFNAALWSVDINLTAIQDSNYVTQVRTQYQGWQDRANHQSTVATEIIQKRMFS